MVGILIFRVEGRAESVLAQQEQKFPIRVFSLNGKRQRHRSNNERLSGGNWEFVTAVSCLTLPQKKAQQQLLSSLCNPQGITYYC